MPNTKHLDGVHNPAKDLIELQILEKCENWLVEQNYPLCAKMVSEFTSYHFDADNNKEL